MPVSYFPPLPQNIWGNLEGNIELQKDLIELIEDKADNFSAGRNLLINPSFRIWQRVANQFNIISRSRAEDIAELETDKPHGFQTGDTVQITQMDDSDYDNPNAIITVVNDSKFSYSNTGANETESPETSGKGLLTNRNSIVPNDADYTADRWIALSESSGQVILTQEDNVCGKNAGLKAKATSTGKFGLLQVLPHSNIKELLDEKLSAAVKVKSTSSAKVKIALVSWNDSKDNITRDIINNWAIEGSNPLLVSNWNFEKFSNSAALSSELQTIKLENIEISSSNVKNIGLFIWFENVSADEEISITEAQLTPTAELLPFKSRAYTEELELCRNFYQKSYPKDEAPGKITGAGSIVFPASAGVGNGNFFGTTYMEEMYKVPNIKLTAPADPPEDGKWRLTTGANAGVEIANKGEKSFAVKNNSGTTVSTSEIYGHYTAESEL